MRTCFPKNSNQKSQSKITFNQCNSEEGDEWKKLYHFRSRLWNHWIQKLKVTRQDLDIILRLNLLYLWEYLPFFLVSPGCCTLVCTPTGVYKKEGGPRSSHYFAFQKILSTIYVYGDGNTTCILIRNFIKKGFTKCYTDQAFEKFYCQTKVWLLLFFNKSIFLFVFRLSLKGYYGMHMNKKSKKMFPLNDSNIYAAQHTVGNLFSTVL